MMRWVVGWDPETPLPAPLEALRTPAVRRPRIIFPLVGEDAIRHAYNTALEEPGDWRRLSVCRVTDPDAFRMYFSRDEASLAALEHDEVAELNLRFETNVFRYVYENPYRFPACAEIRTVLIDPEAVSALLAGADVVRGRLRCGTAIEARPLYSLDDFEVEAGDWVVVGDDTHTDQERRTFDAEPVDRVVLHEDLGDEVAVAVPVTDKVVLWPLREAKKLMDPETEGSFSVFLGPDRTPCVIQWLLPSAVLVTASAVEQFRDGTASTRLRQKYGFTRLVDSFNLTVASQAARLEEAAAQYFGICALPALLAEHPFVQEPEGAEVEDLLLSRTGAEAPEG